MAEAHTALGLAFMKQGKPDAAMKEYAQALECQPDSAVAHYNLANALAQRGQIQDACQHYQEALRTDPDSPDAHNNLAFILARLGRLPEAVEQYRAALSLKPALWQAHLGLGDTFSKLGRFQGALREYREVLRTQPDSVDALNRLAWMLAACPVPQLRNGAEGVELATRACKLTDYKQASLLGTLSVACAEAGRFADAVSVAEKAQELAQAAGQSEIVGRNQQRIELFRAGRAYHDGER
jgi:Flp pilus assembly protein TadD